MSVNRSWAHSPDSLWRITKVEMTIILMIKVNLLPLYSGLSLFAWFAWFTGSSPRPSLSFPISASGSDTSSALSLISACSNPSVSDAESSVSDSSWWSWNSDSCSSPMSSISLSPSLVWLALLLTSDTDSDSSWSKWYAPSLAKLFIPWGSEGPAWSAPTSPDPEAEKRNI